MAKESEEKLNALYDKGDWKGFLDACEDIRSKGGFDDITRFRRGNAYYQLGEYETSAKIMEALAKENAPDAKTGQDARRMWGHSVLQKDGDIEEADRIIKEIPDSLARENLRMNAFIVAARKGVEIPVSEIMSAIERATEYPHETVNGHVINNASLALFEAREQKEASSYLEELPAFMIRALGIYTSTGTPKNHIGGLYFRLAKMYSSIGRIEAARSAKKKCVQVWEEIVKTEGSERYRQNLKGAMNLDV